MSGPTLTGEERVAYLVKLAMEAFDHYEGSNGTADFRAMLTERMRQGCQVWQAEVDMAKEESR
jgi:hypothetical protein